MIALWLLACMSSSDEIPTHTVEMGDFEHVLSIPGELKAVHSATISAPDLSSTLKVISIIEEGSRVSEGDTLVEFDTSELVSDLEGAQTKLEVAQTKIAQKQAQFEVRIGDIKNAVTRAELNLKRAEMRLTDSETVPRVERESTVIDVEQSTLEVERSQAALESARLEGEAELQLLRLEEEQVSARVERVRDNLTRCTLTAPGDGLVILEEIWKGGSRGKVTTGDTIYRGSTIITLPDMAEMEVEAWVHEVDAGLVAAEMPVSVVIDAYPDPPFEARIRKIADLAVQRERGSEVKHLKVSIAMAETSGFMKPGMTVRSEVLITKLPGVMSVPLEGIFSGDDEQYVFTRGLGDWKRTTVTTGPSNDTHIIIESGLAVGDVLALVDPDVGAGAVAERSE
ncbi:MAG: efflux RND transporter periplasmic adaptor subunit [Myxococcota bacterium]|nr:efflux RND transporter periplasmic adaptor subunit [Myxococcota bacterium]